MRFPLVSLALLVVLDACTLTNHPPSLVPLGDRSVRVGETLEFDVAAEDGDGDTLHFAMRFLDPLPPETAMLTPVAKDTARFRWSPLISEALGTGRKIPVRFVVEDGYGGSDEAEITLTVFREGGVPVFLNPHGYMLDLAAREYVSFVVEVKDDDSATVAIAMEHPIEGALLERLGPKTAEFYWRPSGEQIAAQLFHTVVFSADDGEHPPVSYEIGVVLLNAGSGGDCPGTPPRVLHAPPSDVFGGGELEIKADLSDGESIVRYPSVAYSLGDGPGAPEGTLALTVGADGRYRATLPTAALPDDAEVLVRYHLTAEDNDDLTADRCDHASRAPKDGSFVAAWMGSNAGGLCVDDGAEPDDARDGAPLFTVGTSVERRLCPGNVDHLALDLGAASKLAIRATLLGPQGDLELVLFDESGALIGVSTPQPAGARLDVPAGLPDGRYTVAVSSASDQGLAYSLEAADAGASCPGDELEPNDDPATAPTLAEGTYPDLVLCPGELDAYRVTVPPGENLAVTVHFLHQRGDLDLLVLDAAGQTLLAASETTFDDERVFLVDPGVSEVLVAVLGYGDAGNTYDLELATGGDDELCQDDVFAPNASPATAAPIIEGTWEGLVLCPGTSDWFALGLNGGETLEVTIATASVPDLLTVVAAGPASASEPVTCEVVEGGLGCRIAITEPGTWRWGVSASSGLVVYGQSAWAVEPAGPCLDDRLEPNDVAGKSVELAAGVTSHLKLCDGDSDWFHVDLSAFQPLEVYALTVPGAGTLDLELRDEAGATIGQATTPDEGAAVLQVSAPAAGRYRLLVVAPGVPNLFYDLVVVLP